MRTVPGEKKPEKFTIMSPSFARQPKFIFNTLSRWHNVRKSIAEDDDDEPDDPIKVSDSSKPFQRRDRNPSGSGVWERTATSLRVRAPAIKPDREKVRAKKARGSEHGRRQRFSTAVPRPGELTAISSPLKIENWKPTNNAIPATLFFYIFLLNFLGSFLFCFCAFYYYYYYYLTKFL